MSQSSRWLNERSLIAVALLLIPVALLLSTQGLTFAELGGAFSPMFFPSIALWLWIGLAGLNLLSGVLSKEPQQAAPLWRVAIIALGFVGYAWAIMSLGFLLSSVLFCVLCLISLGMRKPLVVAGFSIGLPAVLFILFNHVLMLPLPRSSWTHLF